MDRNLDEASKLEKQAEKEFKGSFFGNMFGSKENRGEKAIECLTEACNLYKLSKLFGDSGRCYERIAEIQSEIGISSADAYEEAAHSYSFVDPQKTILVTNKAMKIYEKQGRFQNVI